MLVHGFYRQMTLGFRENGRINSTQHVKVCSLPTHHTATSPTLVSDFSVHTV